VGVAFSTRPTTLKGKLALLPFAPKRGQSQYKRGRVPMAYGRRWSGIFLLVRSKFLRHSRQSSMMSGDVPSLGPAPHAVGAIQIPWPFDECSRAR
jgi:hypothetical protein